MIPNKKTPFFLAARVQAGTNNLAGFIHSVCHCPGDHIIEIPRTDGLTVKTIEKGGFIDSGDMYHDRPFDPIDRATLVDETGLNKAVWVDRCEFARMRMYFPSHPTDTLCWVMTIRIPEPRKRETTTEAPQNINPAGGS